MVTQPLPVSDASRARVRLPDGEMVPALGQGTWKMAETRGRRADEIAALRAGV